MCAYSVCKHVLTHALKYLSFMHSPPSPPLILVTCLCTIPGKVLWSKEPIMFIKAYSNSKVMGLQCIGGHSKGWIQYTLIGKPFELLLVTLIRLLKHHGNDNLFTT